MLTDTPRWSHARDNEVVPSPWQATLLGCGEINEEQETEPGQLKELVLVIDWRRPLHVVIIVDQVRGEERIVTVYEPDPERWSHDYRRRRR